jgi:hypothetical protein
MMFTATFNNILVISWWSVLLVEATGVPGEIHRPVPSHFFFKSVDIIINVQIILDLKS